MGRLDLLDVCKEADFLTEFTSEFSSVASREVIDRSTLWRRLLLVLFALETNIGIRQVVATGEHGETAQDSRSHGQPPTSVGCGHISWLGDQLTGSCAVSGSQRI